MLAIIEKGPEIKLYFEKNGVRSCLTRDADLLLCDSMGDFYE